MTSPLSRPAFQVADEFLKSTTSRCPVCHVSCPAEVWRAGGIPAKVFLKRTCPEHGEASVCIASDARFYWLAKGKAENACCSRPSPERGLSQTAAVSGTGEGSIFSKLPSASATAASWDNARSDNVACCASDGSPAGTLGRNANPGDALGVMEKLSTCLALIEIVNSCNLSCPTCYADSPLGTGQKIDAVPLTELQTRIQGVIDRKGKIEILQLSGGEPTLHPQFFELLRWLHANPGIDYVLLNTNGVRIAHDEAFAAELAATFRYGKFQLYLQFDGTQEAAQRKLRGADLRATRERCLTRCAEMKLPVTLAMTVTPENLPNLWDATEFGLRWPNVRGISFQPMFQSGRVSALASGALGKTFGARESFPQKPDAKPQTRLNAADIILAAVAQSAGKLRFEDFTPLPCGDPNCATIGYLLKVGGEIRSVSDFVDFKNVQGFLGTKVRYKLEDLMKCGCESEPLGELLKQFELDESHTFRLFIKPFMDAATWDEDRIDRCCTHVIRPDGKLDSFCRYYSGFADCNAK
ncbi:MAG TPA: radical SAM protein [Verrucomicrobiae bacterium]|nr:radical SAM protein [Verrucomicrobiae bacterium]